jgi:short-subunit dehydrogenase
MKLQNKTILITGASSGIGKAVALRVARDGATVLLAARSREKLEAVAREVESLGGIAEVYICDVTSFDDIKNLFLSATKDGRVLDVVFNNAGLGYVENLVNLKEEQIKKIIDVNIYGMIMVSKVAAEVFSRQKHGHIIMTSSVAGLIALPQWSVYVASKWAITGFASCIRPELKPYGVKVTTLHPGLVKTEFFDADNANLDIKNMGEAITSEEVAGAVYDAIFTDKKKIIIPAIAKSYAFLFKYLPGISEKLLESRAGEIENKSLSGVEDMPEFDYIKSIRSEE